MMSQRGRVGETESALHEQTFTFACFWGRALQSFGVIRSWLFRLHWGTYCSFRILTSGCIESAGATDLLPPEDGLGNRMVTSNPKPWLDPWWRAKSSVNKPDPGGDRGSMHRSSLFQNLGKLSWWNKPDINAQTMIRHAITKLLGNPDSTLNKQADGPQPLESQDIVFCRIRKWTGNTRGLARRPEITSSDAILY